MKTAAIFFIFSFCVVVQAQGNISFPDFSVNELHMLPDSGRSGMPITISYTINNTEQFSAFQFDILLPSVLTYVQDSIWLFRNTNHIVISNLVTPDILRIVAYSPTNQPFTGNDGEVVRIMFILNGPTGIYDVGLSNVVISSPVGMDILTGYYPSYVKITAPDITGATNIVLGEVSVLDTLSYDYQLSNIGDDTLFVTDFFSSETFFWVDTPLPQTIPPSTSKTFTLKFHNILKGQYTTTYTIRSNDPDEDPFYVDAVALSFAPNYIIMQNAEAYVGDTVSIKVSVDNYEQFFDFQFDFQLPDSLHYIINSATLTNRKQDHTLHEAFLTSNILRLFTYSPSHLPFLGDTGTVAIMNFVAGNDTGTFPLILSGGILYDSTSQNIIRATIDGEIHIQYRPTFQLSVDVADGWNMVSVPGINPDGMGTTTWWSGLTGNVFSYIGGYNIIITTTPTEGYWMKHIGANTYNTGDEWSAGGIQIAAHDSIPGNAGWNLIGGYENSATVTNITTNPPGLVDGPVFGYVGGYTTPATMEPGYGYWIKLSAVGDIILPSVLSKEGGDLVEWFKEDWGRIIITDAEGRSFTLYATDGKVNLNSYEMPPVPPEGSFDIRFSSNRIAEDINAAIQTIEMSSGVEYPIVVKVENMDIRVQDESGRMLNETIKAGEQITINNHLSKLLITGEVIPDEYALEQNYPNPFNPSTVIEFSLPEDVSNVRLTIYNALGEKVAELVNTTLEAGKYSYQWDATNAATGMYIYELRTNSSTGGFISVKKMLMIK